MNIMNEQDEQIAMQIWHDHLQSSRKPFRWLTDFRSINVIHQGTSFRVRCNITGLVEITMTIEGNFNISIKPDNTENVILRENVIPQNIVSVIDAIIREGVTSENSNPTDYRKAS